MSRRCSSSVFRAPGEMASGYRIAFITVLRVCAAEILHASRTDAFRMTGCLTKSRIDAAQFQGAGHAINRHNICGDTIIHPVGFGVKHNLIETLLHHVLQAFIYFALAPEKALAILHPLEVADGDASGISKNVRDDEDSLFLDDRVGVRRGGAVGALA